MPRKADETSHSTWQTGNRSRIQIRKPAIRGTSDTDEISDSRSWLPERQAPHRDVEPVTDSR